MFKSTLREMDLLDLDAVYTIEKRAHAAPWSKEILYHCLVLGYACKVLCIQKVLIGFCIHRIYSDTVHILNLCIDPNYQKKGYGKYLLNKSLRSVLAEPRISEIRLEVRVSNQRAIHLYQNAGFVVHSIVKNYYKDEVGIEDAFLLVKKINKSVN